MISRWQPFSNALIKAFDNPKNAWADRIFDYLSAVLEQATFSYFVASLVDQIRFAIVGTSPANDSCKMSTLFSPGNQTKQKGLWVLDLDHSPES